VPPERNLANRSGIRWSPAAVRECLARGTLTHVRRIDRRPLDRRPKVFRPASAGGRGHVLLPCRHRGRPETPTERPAKLPSWHRRWSAHEAAHEPARRPWTSSCLRQCTSLLHHAARGDRRGVPPKPSISGRRGQAAPPPSRPLSHGFVWREDTDAGRLNAPRPSSCRAPAPVPAASVVKPPTRPAGAPASTAPREFHGGENRHRLLHACRRLPGAKKTKNTWRATRLLFFSPHRAGEDDPPRPSLEIETKPRDMNRRARAPPPRRSTDAGPGRRPPDPRRHRTRSSRFRDGTRPTRHGGWSTPPHAEGKETVAVPARDGLGNQSALRQQPGTAVRHLLIHGDQPGRRAATGR